MVLLFQCPQCPTLWRLTLRPGVARSSTGDTRGDRDTNPATQREMMVSGKYDVMLTWPPTQSRTLVITIWKNMRNVATIHEILWRFVSILLLEQHPCLMRSFPPHCLGSRDDWTSWTQVQRPGIIASFGGQDTLLSIIYSQFTDDDVHYRVLISLMSTTVQ